MDFRIIEKEAFYIIGKGIRVSIANGDNTREIPAYWSESNENGFTAELGKNLGPMGYLGVCTEFNPSLGEFTYYIAVEKMTEKVSEDCAEIEIPAATWAVFESVGPLPEPLLHVWEYVFKEWFPTSGYKHANAPELEVYYTGNTTDENYRCEVWVPVEK